MAESVIAGSIAQSNGRRTSRLPVVTIALRSYSSLVVYLPEFGRLVWMTFLFALGARLMQLCFEYLELPAVVTSGWALASHFVIFTPFLVSWTQLSVDGTQRVVSKRPFKYGPIEWRYLLADAVIMTAFGVATCSVGGTPLENPCRPIRWSWKLPRFADRRHSRRCRATIDVRIL